MWWNGGDESHKMVRRGGVGCVLRGCGCALRPPPPHVGPVSHPYELTQQDEGQLDRHHANAVSRCTGRPAKWRDRLSGCQWYLSDSRAGVFDVNVEPAWGATLGEGVTVLVVDYPVDYRHEDLRDNIDLAGSPGLTEAAVTGSDTSHGAAMASIIAARDNAVGFRGVAPRAALTWRSINSVEIHSYLAVDDANTWSTCVEVIDADGSVAGAWVPGCASYRGAPAPAQYYTFTLDSESQVTIELQSSSGSNLYVRNGYALSGGWIAHDYGFKRNSRVSRTLPAGVYTIEATTYLAERSTGSFTLQVAGLDGVSVPEAIESGRRWAPVWDSLLEAAVVNRSYTATNRTRPYKDESGDLGHLSAYEVYGTMAEFGFGGRGTLNVVSGGKTFPVPGLVQWSTLAEEGSHPAVVVACAVDLWGRRNARSNTSLEGPSLWVCAPLGGIVEAKLGDRYFISNGTPSSPATALVSGVAALVRSIDANLSWRDVKLILAASAQHNDPDDAGWQHGAAVYGAAQQSYRYHHSYGFGVVDAGAAVLLARNWRYLPEYRSEHISAPTLSSALTFPDDGSTVTADLDVDPEIDFIEYVEAHLVLDAPWFRDLEVELESPSGTVSRLSVPVGDVRGARYAGYDCKQASECGISGSFRFGTSVHLGEDPAGTWTLRLADRRPNGGTNTLESWSLRFFGHKSSDPTPNLTPSPTFEPWPQVSITAGPDIDEGDNATFTVIADPVPSEALDVTLAVTAAGDFGVSPGSRQVTVPTTGTVTLTVATTGDSADEADGSVTATVVSGSGYSVSQSAGSASVAVADDDDAPCDTADARARARAAFVWHTDNDGGNEVWFWQILAYLGADPMPAPPDGGVLASTTPEAVRAFSDGKTWPGWVPINAAMSCHTPPPVVSIAAGADVGEGGDATFTVTADPAPSAALDVTVGVAQTGDFGVPSGSHTVTVPVSGSATFAVATTDDSADEVDGSVTATVAAGSGYTVSAAAGAAAVAVADDDDAVRVADRCVGALSGDGSVSGVWAAGCGSSARAGRLARFLSFSLDSPSRVTVDLKSSADTYLYLRRGVGQRSGAAVASDDDGGAGYNSRISRHLGAGGYTIEATTYHSSTGGSFTLRVDGIGTQSVVPPDPVVSIAASADVTEGSDATFTVTADPAPSEALDVTVAVTAAGDFGVSPGSHTVTVPSSGSATLTVATVGDSVDEPDGSVTATLSAGTGYTVSTTAGTASVAVADDDDPPAVTPEVSIAAGSTITEGSDATFTVTADPAPSAALTATVTVTQTGDYGAATGTRQVTIPTSGTATLTVATTDDSTDETDGSVTVTVGGGTGYTVSQTAGTATVAVADDDPPCDTADAITQARAAFAWHTDNNGGSAVLFWQVLSYLGADPMPAPPGGTVPASITPEAVRTFSDGKAWPGWVVVNAAMQCRTSPSEVSITAGGGIGEGGDAVFTVSAVPAPSAALDVTVAVTVAGDFGVPPGSHTVTIPTTGTATLTVTTANDSVDEADGSVTATVSAGTGYTVSATAGSATVAVADDDDPPAVTPEVSIAAGSTITEGSDATFTVTADPAPSAALTATVTVTQTGDYGAATGTRQVTIPTSGTATLTVATTDDSTDETDGSVTATVDANSGYTVSATAGSATVAVADDDDPPAVTPEVSIAAGSTITEGSDATFTVTADPAPSAALTATVTVTQTGDYGAATGTRQVTIPTSGTVTLTVATTDDSADEADGSVTVSIDVGSGYTVSQSAGSASVAVADDDDPPPPPPSDPGFAVHDATGAEGEPLRFRVTLSTAPRSTQVSAYWITSESGGSSAATAGVDYSSRARGWLDFGPGDTELWAQIPLLEDDRQEPQEQFLVKLIWVTPGLPIADGQATMTITDND